MRAVLAVLALTAFGGLSGCVELGVVTDGSSISYGKPNNGYLVDGVKLPDKGDGYTTREVWSLRGNRYGTDELVTMVKGVAKRMKKKVKDVRLVVADLSNTTGGAEHAFHRSHQNGRDADLLYYMRDAEGKPFEADAMHVFNARGEATDGSGITVDVPRTWLLVKELLTAREAYVQYIFMYRPIVQKLIEHATKIKESPELIARATMALKQPGDSAPHNDHMHVRVYCAASDRQFGCVDIGPLELLAMREAEEKQVVEAIASQMPQEPAPTSVAATDAMAPDEAPPALTVSATDVWMASSAPKPSLPTGPSSSATATAVTSGPASATGPSVAVLTVSPQSSSSSSSSSVSPVSSAPSIGSSAATSSGTLSSSAAASFGSLFRAR